MLTFPCFKYLTWRPRLVGQVTIGGQGSNGQVQSARTDGGGRWVFELGDASLNERLKLKAWRAFEALLDGGVTEVILMLCDKRQAPGFVAGQGGHGIPHSDGTLFSDGTGYSQEGGIPYTAAAAALRATEITLDTIDNIEGGENFSILHPTAGWRLYRLGALDGNVATIRPPLREAITDETQLEFFAPRCVVRLMDADGYAPTVERLRYAKGSVTFMESLDYAS